MVDPGCNTFPDNFSVPWTSWNRKSCFTGTTTAIASWCFLNIVRFRGETLGKLHTGYLGIWWIFTYSNPIFLTLYVNFDAFLSIWIEQVLQWLYQNQITNWENSTLIRLDWFMKPKKVNWYQYFFYLSDSDFCEKEGFDKILAKPEMENFLNDSHKMSSKKWENAFHLLWIDCVKNARFHEIQETVKFIR